MSYLSKNIELVTLQNENTILKNKIEKIIKEDSDLNQIIKKLSIELEVQKSLNNRLNEIIANKSIEMQIETDGFSIERNKAKSNSFSNISHDKLSVDSSFKSTFLNKKRNNEMLIKYNSNNIENEMMATQNLYLSDSIESRKAISESEEKIRKNEKVFKKWIDNYESFKKSIVGMNKFNGELDLFSVLLELSDKNEEMNTAINLCIEYFNETHNQIINNLLIFDNTVNSIKEAFNSQISKYNINRSLLNKNFDEFTQQLSKVQSLKKKSISDSLKDSYMSTKRKFELTRFDFFSNINDISYFFRIQLPEKLCFLAKSLIILINQLKNNSSEFEDVLNNNINKCSIKLNIIQRLKNNSEILRNEIDKNPNFPFIEFYKNKPSIEGFLNCKALGSSENFKKRYFKILKDELVYFRYKNEIIEEDSVSFCKLFMISLKKETYDYHFCFELVNAAERKTYLFQCENETELEIWYNSLKNAISYSISAYNNPEFSSKTTESFKDSIGPQINLNISDKSNQAKTSFNLLDSTSNKKDYIDNLINTSKCCDCNSDKPSWFSISWFTILCIECSGIHRSLGVKFSKIKSLSLDNIEDEYFEILNKLQGYQAINNIIEKNCSSIMKIEMINISKENFIENKYKKLKYVDESKLDLAEFISLVDSENINGLFQYYCFSKNNLENSFFYSDYSDYLNKSKNEDNVLYSKKFTSAHYIARKGKLLCLKLFYCLGIDIYLTDDEGLKPIDYATLYKQVRFNFSLIRSII